MPSSPCSLAHHFLGRSQTLHFRFLPKCKPHQVWDLAWRTNQHVSADINRAPLEVVPPPTPEVETCAQSLLPRRAKNCPDGWWKVTPFSSKLWLSRSFKVCHLPVPSLKMSSVAPSAFGIEFVHQVLNALCTSTKTWKISMWIHVHLEIYCPIVLAFRYSHCTGVLGIR